MELFWGQCGELLYGLSLVQASGSYFLVAVRGLLILAASVVVEDRLKRVQASAAAGLSCSAACGIFLSQGSNWLVSPALAGRFFTTEPPRKPMAVGFLRIYFSCLPTLALASLQIKPLSS